jgi:SAM-dependent methyltransferase
VSKPSSWWEHFFEGAAVDLWLRAVPPDHSEREADLIAGALGAAAGAELLDVPCGGGRLSLALCRRGYRMTGVDWSVEFLNHARAVEGAGAVAWERRDMRDLPWRSRFDGAFCFGNSFGYLDDEGNAAFLRAVAATLKPGARFILETPMVLENLLGHIQERAWWQVGDMRLLVVNKYDAGTQRLDTEYTFLSDGRCEVKSGSHRTFTFRELVDLLEGAGFAVETDRPWTRGATSVTFIATRVGT